ncbi:MAG: hypothetical protein ABII00_05660 [Elusimicrobiota bacterium]
MLLTNWKKAGVLLIGVFTAVALFSDRRARESGAALALEVREARALWEASGYPETYFWERARALGIAGAVLRTEPLGRHLRSGEVLRFSTGEIEKLRATGVAAPQAPLKPDALWMKDDALFARLMGWARAHGIALSAQRYGDMHVVEPPGGMKPEALSVGYDPAVADAVSRQGLTPVYFVVSEPELRLARGAGGPAALLIPPGYGVPETSPGPRGPVPETTPGRAPAWVAERLADRSLWLAFLKTEGGTDGRRVRVAFLQGVGGPSPRMLTAGEIPPGAGLATLLREISGGGNRLVVAHLDPSLGIEENLGWLRSLLKGMRSGGYPPTLPSGLHEARRVSAGEWGARFSLGSLLTVIGPLLALRWGLKVLRSMHRAGRLPEAAPFREAVSALAAAAGAGAALGLGAYALLAVAAWRLEATSLCWGPAAPATTLLLASMAMFLPEAGDLPRLIRRPWVPLSRALPVLAVAALLLSPPGWLRRWGPEGWLECLAAWRPAWWWAASRWRELFVGYPCLFVGLCVYFQRLDAGGAAVSRGAPADPRIWLLFGMFALLGLAEVLAGARTPFELALLHTGTCAALGVALGLVVLAGRGAVRYRLRT